MMIFLITFIFTSDTENSSSEKHNNCKNYHDCSASEDWEYIWFKSQEEIDEERRKEKMERFLEAKRRLQEANEGWLRWLVRKFFGLFSSGASTTEMTEDSCETDSSFETESSSQAD